MLQCLANRITRRRGHAAKSDKADRRIACARQNNDAFLPVDQTFNPFRLALWHIDSRRCARVRFGFHPGPCGAIHQGIRATGNGGNGNGGNGGLSVAGDAMAGGGVSISVSGSGGTGGDAGDVTVTTSADATVSTFGAYASAVKAMSHGGGGGQEARPRARDV